MVAKMGCGLKMGLPDGYEGRAVYVNQAGNFMRQLIARYGTRSDPGNPNFNAAIAELNVGYQPINGNYPAPAPGT